MNKSLKAAYELIPIFDSHVFYGNDIAAIRKKVLQYKVSKKVELDTLDVDEGPLFSGYTFGMQGKKEGDERIYLWVLYVKKGEDLSVLAHECTHLSRRILKYVGHTIRGDNDEIQAHLCGYLFESFRQKIHGVKSKGAKPLKKMNS